MQLYTFYFVCIGKNQFYVLFQASVKTWMTTALFRVITLQEVVISYRRFEILQP